MRKQVIRVVIDPATGEVSGDIVEGSPGGVLCEQELRKALGGLSDQVSVEKKPEYWKPRIDSVVMIKK